MTNTVCASSAKSVILSGMIDRLNGWHGCNSPTDPIHFQYPTRPSPKCIACATTWSFTPWKDGIGIWFMGYFTTLSCPVVDGFRRRFHHAIQSDVGAERTAYQLIVNLDNRVDCVDIGNGRNNGLNIQAGMKLGYTFVLNVLPCRQLFGKTYSER